LVCLLPFLSSLLLLLVYLLLHFKAVGNWNGGIQPMVESTQHGIAGRDCMHT
jgi:hypothetical protein